MKINLTFKNEQDDRIELLSGASNVISIYRIMNIDGAEEREKIAEFDGIELDMLVEQYIRSEYLCSACDGSGVLYEIPFSNEDEITSKTCPVCHGSGLKD